MKGGVADGLLLACCPDLAFAANCLELVVALGLEGGAVDAIRLEELGEALEGPLAAVVHDLVVALLEELDGGEALHLDVLNLVGGGVHLGNDDALVVLELLAQLVPDGSQLLAVA